MTQQDHRHPITPPPELVRQWMERTEYDEHTWFYESYIAEQAAQWGADQELEACCGLLIQQGFDVVDDLRAARRPKPPSLKEQALQALSHLLDGAAHSMDTTEPADYIRRALEQLDD